MKSILAVLVTIAVLVPAAGLCNEPQGQARSVSPKQAWSMLVRGADVWIVDVRGPLEFEKCHIEGSVNINVASMELNDYPKKRTYVIVDDSIGQVFADEALDVLRDAGYRKSVVLSGGILGWADADLPLVGEVGVVRAYMPVPVDADELDRAVKSGREVKVYDMRSDRREKQAGFAGFVPLPGDTVESRLDALVKILRRSGAGSVPGEADARKNVVLVYDTGADAESLSVTLSRLGVADVRYLSGGYGSLEPGDTASVVWTSDGGCATCP